MKLLSADDARLRQGATALEHAELRQPETAEAAREMVRLCKSNNGVAIAGPQIGNYNQNVR